MISNENVRLKDFDGNMCEIFYELRKILSSNIKSVYYFYCSIRDIFYVSLCSATFFKFKAERGNPTDATLWLIEIFIIYDRKVSYTLHYIKETQRSVVRYRLMVYGLFLCKGIHTKM